jgi:uracil-DNA glycosylase
VLFLNTCLTVRAHNANSHAGRGWEQLTTAALRAVAQRTGGKGVVFFVWGQPAQKTCKAVGIDEVRSLLPVASPRGSHAARPPQDKHLVLRSSHPSPLSAYRGFLGNAHFKRANDWLETRYGAGGGIDWTCIGGAQP